MHGLVSDVIRWQRSDSPLAQVMACCLVAPSHNLNQCWRRACLFSKSSLAQLQEFWNSYICLHEIKRKNLFKSTCPTGSFTCPGPLGSGKRWALLTYHQSVLWHLPGGNRMAWQWAETLVEIRGTLADIRGTTKYGIRYHFPKHEFNRPVCLEAHHYLLAHLSQ